MTRIQNFFRFWTENRGLVFLLVSISLLIFIIYPIAGNSSFASLVTNVFFMIVLFSGLMSVDIKPKIRRILIITLLIIVLFSFIGELLENNFVTHLHLFSRIIFLWMLIVLIFMRVFDNNSISFFYRITGSITIYVLIGFIWANMYYIIYMFSPQSFHFDSSINPDDNIMFNFIYFSFETLTTLGLGDVLPVHPMLKSLVLLEALLGPLYLAVLIGRLVSVRKPPQQ